MQNDLTKVKMFQKVLGGLLFKHSVQLSIAVLYCLPCVSHSIRIVCFNLVIHFYSDK